eukprot:GFYU01015571.1.p1 GENE.GFYU01015571.1~~GFYU01015571.1.p1  ORF type:complete len:565 (-),score=166.87 GFYU01015571.1:51-1745(-)
MATETKRTSLKRQMARVLFAYCIFIAGGVPVWWVTTEVVRYPLPTQQIQDNTFTTVSTDNLPIHLHIHTPHDTPANIVRALQSAVETQSQQSGEHKATLVHTHSTRLPTPPASTTHGDSTQRLHEYDTQLQQVLEASATTSTNGHYHVLLGEGESGVLEKGHLYMGTHRHMWMFVDKLSSATTPGIVASAVCTAVRESIVLPFQSSTEAKSILRVAPSAQYRLSFALLNGDFDSTVLEWEFSSVLNVLQPVVTALNRLAHFTVDSQVLNVASLAEKPVFTHSTEHGESHVLTKALCGSALDLNALGLTSGTGDFTTTNLHFLIFYPPKGQRPLKFVDEDLHQVDKREAYIIPQWGGFTALNAIGTDDDTSRNGIVHHTVTPTEMLPALKYFTGHLRDLLGLSAADSSSRAGTSSSIHYLRSPHGVCDYEIDALKRLHIDQNVSRVNQVLKSLSKLVDEIHTIPLPEDLRDDMQSAFDTLTSTWETMSTQTDIDYEHVHDRLQRARDMVERVSRSDTMMIPDSIPDEFKYAVYVPLFVPMFVPVVSALARELSARRKRAKEQKLA